MPASVGNLFSERPYENNFFAICIHLCGSRALLSAIVSVFLNMIHNKRLSQATLAFTDHASIRNLFSERPYENNVFAICIHLCGSRALLSAIVSVFLNMILNKRLSQATLAFTDHASNLFVGNLFFLLLFMLERPYENNFFAICIHLCGSRALLSAIVSVFLNMILNKRLSQATLAFTDHASIRR